MTFPVLNPGDGLSPVKEELEYRSRRHIKIIIDDPGKAERLLRTNVSTNFEVTSDNIINLYGCIEEAAGINRMLVSSGLAVSAFAPGEQDLEGFFMDMPGGKK